MTTGEQDPIAQAERVIREAHESARHTLHPVHRRYPLLFLLLLTFSVAAIFHGLDHFLDQFEFLNQVPLLLTVLGILGLFITGSLYKRLGQDKYE